MNIEIVKFNDVGEGFQHSIANQTSLYTSGFTEEKPQMLAISPEDIFKKYMGYVAVSGDEFCGYIGSSLPQRWNNSSMSEVGTLWVPKAHRNQGLAHELVKKISGSLVEEKVSPYAFCNSLSESIFLDSGFQETTSNNIPPSAFDLCAFCPKKENDGCCDKMVIYQGGLI